MEFREEWALPSQRLRLQFRVLEFQLCSTATEHDANSSYYCFSSTRDFAYSSRKARRGAESLPDARAFLHASAPCEPRPQAGSSATSRSHAALSTRLFPSDASHPTTFLAYAPSLACKTQHNGPTEAESCSPDHRPVQQQQQ